MREYINNLKNQIKQIWCKIKELENSTPPIVDYTLQDVVNNGDTLTNSPIEIIRNDAIGDYLFSTYTDNNTTAKWGQFVIYQDADGYLNTYTALRSTNASTPSISTYYGYQALKAFPKSNTTTSTRLTAFGYKAGYDIASGNNNNFYGGNSGGGIIAGSGNTIIGSYQFPASTTLNNSVVISDGTNTRIVFQTDSTGLTTVPTQTIATYTADSTGKAVVTKDVMSSLPAFTINGTSVPLGGSVSVNAASQIVTVKKLTSAVTSSVVARAIVSEWTFAVVAGKSYKIDILGGLQTVATTTGGSLGIIMTGGGTGTVIGNMRIGITATTYNETTIRIIDAVGSTAQSFLTSTGVAAVNVPHLVQSSMIFNCTANGTFNMTFGSEVASSAATLNANSVLVITEL